MAKRERTRRFKAAESVQALLDPTVDNFTKVWALARLIGYSALDQRVRSKTKQAPDGKPPLRPTSVYAKNMGMKMLVYLLDYTLLCDEDFRIARQFVKRRGGFSLSAENMGAKSLLRRFSREAMEIDVVTDITLTMCRAHRDLAAAKLNPAKLGVGWAVDFVSREGLSRSTAEKIWQRRHHGAPYLVAFSPLIRNLRRCVKPSEMLARIREIATDSGKVAELLANAAAVADVVASHIGAEPSTDFLNVPRCSLPLEPFNEQERAKIQSYIARNKSERVRMKTQRRSAT